jgi:serine/threonine-protein kinase HipA
MGRRSHTRTLAVWINGELAGHWTLLPNGSQELTYAETWLRSPAGRPLSLSLPLRPASQPHRAGVASFFENLLPDNASIRQRMQRRFGSESDSAFDLLEEAGRDCVGAIQLLREGETPEVRRITGSRLSEKKVADLLRGALGDTWGQQPGEDFRISLAGAQEKTALLWHERAWHAPTGATPTTHILKLPIGTSPQGLDLSTSVENEWLCARIVRAFGLAVAACEIARFGEFKVLVVERFDRRLAPGGKWWLRRPQEDFCQATGTPPALKYENDGGPGIEPIMNILLGSAAAEADRETFMRAQVLFWLLAAIDGHAKNFSVFLEAGGRFRLTPLYDILSAYPVLGHGKGKLAEQKIKMAIAARGKNKHYEWRGIRARHWRETAQRCGFPGMDRILRELVEQTPTVVARIKGTLPKGFSPQIADTVLAGLETKASEVKEELAAGGG